MTKVERRQRAWRSGWIACGLCFFASYLLHGPTKAFAVGGLGALTAVPILVFVVSPLLDRMMGADKEDGPKDPGPLA